MTKGIKNILAALVAAVMSITIFYGVYRYQQAHSRKDKNIKAGFIFDGDASTPYTANFIKAVNQIETTYAEKVETVEKYNVPYEDTEEVITQMVDDGCAIIFTNSYGYGETAKKMAEKYPDVQFCEATCDNANSQPQLKNYHNFMGEIYQARYVSGVVAGAKLKEMIDKGVITKEQALVGFVAAYPVAEVISGYTAFIMGVRSQCESAQMKVKYINTWTNYALEKNVAQQLIDEGCVIISHHSNTIGSAIACENAGKSYPVYHVGYNQDMMNVAPRTALTSCRIDWEPYMSAAIEAVINDRDIESNSEGRKNGRDVSGGFKEGWVKLLEINSALASEDIKKLAQDTIKDFEKGKIHVFKGDYTGVDPNDPNDTYDLNKEYVENEKSSAPTFHYVLKDIITVVE